MFLRSHFQSPNDRTASILRNYAVQADKKCKLQHEINNVQLVILPQTARARRFQSMPGEESRKVTDKLRICCRAC